MSITINFSPPPQPPVVKYLLCTLMAMLSIGTAAAQGIVKDEFADRKKSVRLNTGIHMSYVDMGNTNDIPVLLIHGFTDTGRSFQLVAEELTQINKSIRLIIPDLRGHGDSSMPEDQCRFAPEACFTPEQMAADMINLMDKLGLASVHLVGHSLGSVVAQSMALNYAERIDKMVLIATLVNIKECTGIQEFLIGGLIESDWRSLLEKQAGFHWPEDAYLLNPMDLGLEVIDFLKEYWVVEPLADVEFLSAIFSETIRTKLGTWIGAIKALGNTDNTAAMKNLKTPALIIWANQDELITTVDQDKAKTAFADASKSTGVKVIYGKQPQSAKPGDLGHNFHWAVPKEIAVDINSYIMNDFKETTNYYSIQNCFFCGDQR